MPNFLHDRIQIEEGDDVFLEATEDPFFYIIEQGRIEIWRFEGGKKLVLDSLEAGHIFGEDSYIEGPIRSISATALKLTTIIRVSTESLAETMNGSQPFIRALLKVLFYNVMRLKDILHNNKL